MNCWNLRCKFTETSTTVSPQPSPLAAVAASFNILAPSKIPLNLRASSLESTLSAKFSGSPPVPGIFQTNVLSRPAFAFSSQYGSGPWTTKLLRIFIVLSSCSMAGENEQLGLALTLQRPLVLLELNDRAGPELAVGRGSAACGSGSSGSAPGRIPPASSSS